MTAHDDQRPQFLAGGVRLPDPRLVEPLSIFRDSDGQIWQAVEVAGDLVWQPVYLVSERVRAIGVARLDRLARYILISLGAIALALIAALYLPLHAGLFGGGAFGAMVLPFVRLLIVAGPLIVTLVLVRRRRLQTQWVAGDALDGHPSREHVGPTRVTTSRAREFARTDLLALELLAAVVAILTAIGLVTWAVREPLPAEGLAAGVLVLAVALFVGALSWLAGSRLRAGSRASRQ
jgi:hypothetical protein